MKKQHEQLLVATLAGLIILGAAAFVAQPAMAARQDVHKDRANVSVLTLDVARDPRI